MARREPEASGYTTTFAHGYAAPPSIDLAGRAVVTSGPHEEIRRIVREELRRCGLRPPCPEGLAHRWDPETDAWVPTTQ